jgi:hypothetical protein
MMWAQMEGGELVWDELCNELHHQGDVGLASYAAIPQLVRISEERRGFGAILVIAVLTNSTTIGEPAIRSGRASLRSARVLARKFVLEERDGQSRHGDDSGSDSRLRYRGELR